MFTNVTLCPVHPPQHLDLLFSHLQPEDVDVLPDSRRVGALGDDDNTKDGSEEVEEHLGGGAIQLQGDRHHLRT